MLQKDAPNALARKLENIPKKMTNILLENELTEYEHQVRNYIVDQTLPNYDPDKDSKAQSSGKASNVVCYRRADEWWGVVKKTGRYNQLTKLV